MPTAFAIRQQESTAGRYRLSGFVDSREEGQALDGFVKRPRASVLKDGPTFSGVSNDDVDESLVLEELDQAPLIRFEWDHRLERQFRILQQWEGVVTEVTASDFTIELSDLSDSAAPTEVATLPVREVSDSDRALLQPGAVLYWHIGYETSPGGQQSRVSEIRLRRAPKWTARQLEQHRVRGQVLFDEITANENPTKS